MRYFMFYTKGDKQDFVKKKKNENFNVVKGKN